MPPEREPDRFEKGVRFGCGSLLGILIGLYWAIRSYDSDSWSLFWAGFFFVAATFGCGFLAMRYGDRFWDCLARLAGWWARLHGWIDRRS